ncbi:MAG: FMN-binding negative transcriptional regulator [Actinomycetota bacterium]|nr:FMN-binding negative transcriptional regulator [Actinomycetota bacterium]
MRHTSRYLITAPTESETLIRDHSWTAFVSATSNGLVASHYPVLLDESDPDTTLLSHFGRPDDQPSRRADHMTASGQLSCPQLGSYLAGFGPGAAAVSVALCRDSRRSMSGATASQTASAQTP